MFVVLFAGTKVSPSADRTTAEHLLRFLPPIAGFSDPARARPDPFRPGRPPPAIQGRVDGQTSGSTIFDDILWIDAFFST